MELTSSVSFERSGRIARVLISRPEARNAVDGTVAKGIDAAMDLLEGDDDLWVGVISGGTSVFSAGADLKAIAGGRGGELTTEMGGFAGITRRERSKPLIAAVEGPALAGGLEIALACDLIVAGEGASFGIPEVKRSLVAAAGATFRLPRRIPFNVALEMGLTGDPIPARRAHEVGLVNRVTPDGLALEAAIGLAEKICENAPLAVRETMALMYGSVSETESAGWAQAAQAMARLFATEDFREGPRAFIEKRPPDWKGR